MIEGPHAPRRVGPITTTAASYLSRRAALSHGLRLGLVAPVGAALEAGAGDEGSAAPRPVTGLRSARRQGQRDRLTVLYNTNSFDLNPHTSYSDASLLLLGVYEMLVQLKDDRPHEFAPMLADSWETNADKSAYTFQLSPTAVFQDGSPCDATAVKASFGRFLGLAAGPAGILNRFVQDPAQIVAVDERTLRFDHDRPQPHLLAALASAYGPFVVNPRLVEAHATADAPWADE